MRLGLIICLAGSLASGAALAQSRDLPTPATPGPNPGAAATEAIVSPAKPATVAPSSGGSSSATDATPAPSAPPVPPDRIAPPQPRASATPSAPGPSPSSSSAPAGDLRELIEATRAVAKATQDSVEYGRVVPDILTQILAKLDKLENKLDKIEDILRASPRARR